jgi:hypothetical protein
MIIDSIVILVLVVLILRAVYFLKQDRDPLQTFKPFWEVNSEREAKNRLFDDLG